ncbi:hypothetical protein [Faecalispora anaeroviscerum]|uniref:hypothetical protein n=1 Tax=Faecalispora anaeroviscerum TaxID=2991836 RepID=UPI0024BA1389|nr:hypothetical protein [Faecalispora anaeroviscerum]
MREGYVIKSAQSTAGPEELEQIGRYTRRAFSPEELYVFSVVLCDNEIDRDFERFTIPALHRLGELFLGKTGLFDHSMKSGDQTARIFSTQVETDADQTTQAGEPYTRLVARAYLPKTEKNADLILELESGIKKEVSVGCAVGKSYCSVCGANRAQQGCEHVKGRSYGGAGKEQLCCTVLDEPADAYEWSFVAVPAQRAAGVIKAFWPGKEETESMEEIRKSLHAGEQVTLTAMQAKKLAKHLEQLEALAESGRQYRESVCKNVVRLCALGKTGIPAKAMSRAAQSMELDDLLAFEKALKQQADGVLPLRPQLAPEHPDTADRGNEMFRI